MQRQEVGKKMSEIELRDTLEQLDENVYNRIRDLRAYQRALLQELGEARHTTLDFMLKEDEEIPPRDVDFHVVDDEELIRDQVQRASEKMYTHLNDRKQMLEEVEEHWDDYLRDWERYQEGEIDLEYFTRYGEDPEDFGEEPQVRHDTTVRMYNSINEDIRAVSEGLQKLDHTAASDDSRVPWSG